MNRAINAIGEIRYTSWERITIAAPSNFSIRTQSDLIEEIASAKQHNLPDSIVHRLTRDLVRTRFGSDDIMAELDPLYLKTQEEVASGMALGTISELDAVIHTNILSWLSELGNMDVTMAIATIDKLAKEKLAEIKGQNGIIRQPNS
jgi:hypothetical protein